MDLNAMHIEYLTVLQEQVNQLGRFLSLQQQKLENLQNRHDEVTSCLQSLQTRFDNLESSLQNVSPSLIEGIKDILAMEKAGFW